MQRKKKEQKEVGWEEVLAFLLDKKLKMEKMERRCTDRRKELQVV